MAGEGNRETGPGARTSNLAIVTLTVTAEPCCGEMSAAAATRGPAGSAGDDAATVVPVAGARTAGTGGDDGVLAGAAGGDPAGGCGGSVVPGAAAELSEVTPAADARSIPRLLTVAGAGNPAAAADRAAGGADASAGGETCATRAGAGAGSAAGGAAGGAAEDGGAAAAAPPTIADTDGGVVAPAGVAAGGGTVAATGARTDGAATTAAGVAGPIVRAPDMACGPVSLPGVTDAASAAVSLLG